MTRHPQGVKIKDQGSTDRHIWGPTGPTWSRDFLSFWSVDPCQRSLSRSSWWKKFNSTSSCSIWGALGKNLNLPPCLGWIPRNFKILFFKLKFPFLTEIHIKINIDHIIWWIRGFLRIQPTYEFSWISWYFKMWIFCEVYSAIFEERSQKNDN